MEETYKEERDDIERALNSIAADAEYWKAVAENRWTRYLERGREITVFEEKITELENMVETLMEETKTAAAPLVADGVRVRRACQGDDDVIRRMYPGESWTVNVDLKGSVNGFPLNVTRSVTFELLPEEKPVEVAPAAPAWDGVEWDLTPCIFGTMGENENYMRRDVLHNGEYIAHLDFDEVPDNSAWRWDVVLVSEYEDPYTSIGKGFAFHIVRGTTCFGKWSQQAAERAADNYFWEDDRDRGWRPLCQYRVEQNDIYGKERPAKVKMFDVA